MSQPPRRSDTVPAAAATQRLKQKLRLRLNQRLELKQRLGQPLAAAAVSQTVRLIDRLIDFDAITLIERWSDRNLQAQISFGFLGYWFHLILRQFFEGGADFWAVEMAQRLRHAIANLPVGIGRIRQN
jgi:hypothetical protein